jgi:hypothetical protein
MRLSMESVLLLLDYLMMGFQIGNNHYRWLCHAAIIEAPQGTFHIL